MPKTATAFTHLDETFTKGQDVDDSHPLVALAPHLFVQPKVERSEPDREQRIRGALVQQPTKKAED